MSTTSAAHPHPKARHPHVATDAPGHFPGERRRRPRWVGFAGLAVIAAAVVLAVTVAGRTPAATVSGGAPGFRLASTAGGQVSLADLRGTNVLLFFNEGAGCDSCFYQTAKLEAAGSLAKEGVRLVAVVMNSAAQVQPELDRFGIKQTPYLLDPDGSVARAYKTLGTGHHANLPGHTFVLIGADGSLKWRGDYPGMWVDPKELADVVAANLD